MMWGLNWQFLIKSCSGSLLHEVDVPVLDLNFSTLVYVVEMKVSQAGVRTKFKVLDFQVIVQCVHALFSVNITRFEFV